tara:strand:+ start:10677 stop:11639 length:963 start_codon:yes stop_codon:yes gene_type:complete
MGMKLNITITNIKGFLENLNFLLFKKIFFFISIIYLINSLKVNFNQISLEFDLYKYKFHIIFSVIFCFLSIFLNAYAWSHIISWLGFSKSSYNFTSLHILTNSLKYIPGGIWHFAERFNYLKKITNKYLSFYSILLEPYIMLSCSLLLVSFGVFYSPFLIVFLIPSIFLNKKLIYYVLSKLESFQKKEINIFNSPNSKLKFYSKIKLKSLYPVKTIFLEILFILSKFIGFLICFNIFNENTSQDIFALFIAFCLSWSIGLVIPAAPGGIGVFEASFLFMMSKDLSQSAIIQSLIYFRLLSTFSDLFLSTPFFLRNILKMD